MVYSWIPMPAFFEDWVRARDTRHTLACHRNIGAPHRATSAALLQNVYGMTTNHCGTLETIMTALRHIFTSDGDSYQVQVAILDSKDFQTPQRRKRVYIMGVRKMGRTDMVIEWPAPTGTVDIQSIMKHDAKLASYSSYPLPETEVLKSRIMQAICKIKELVKQQQPPMKAESVPVIVDGYGRGLNWGHR